MRLAHSLAAALVITLAGPSEVLAQSRYQTRAPAQADPRLQAEWVAQLTPGSAVTHGYHRPTLPPPSHNGARSGVFIAHGTLGGDPGYVLQPNRPRAAYIARPAREPYAARPARPAFDARIAHVAPPPRAVDPRYAMDPAYLPTDVVYESGYAPGTIVVDTSARYLYYIQEGDRARRYGVGVGKEGFGWSGTHKITRKAEWPSWTPPKEMIARERRKGRELPAHMEGGLANPLGARALYLGSTLYRIHGTNAPWTIGQAVSSGCIRMRNEDVIELYERTRVGAKVVVL